MTKMPLSEVTTTRVSHDVMDVGNSPTYSSSFNYATMSGMSNSSSTMAAVFPIMMGIIAEVTAIYRSITEVSRPPSKSLSSNLYSRPNTTDSLPTLSSPTQASSSFVTGNTAATTICITVTETAPIIYSVVTVTITAGSGNSKPAALAHGEHTVLSVAGEALVGDDNVVFELYSDRDFGFGQWFSFDSVCNQRKCNLEYYVSLQLDCHLYVNTLKEACCYDSHILQWILLPDPVVPLAISLSPSWPGGPALQQLHFASLQQPPFHPTSPAPVTHPGLCGSQAQNPTSDLRRPCSLPSVRETGYARARPQ